MRPNLIYMTGLFLTMLYALETVCASPPAHRGGQNNATINDSIEYDILELHLGWVTKKTIIKEGDCILIVTQKPGEYPVMRREGISIKADSFYHKPLFDTILSHYICDPSEVKRLWQKVDSVHNAYMEVVITRDDIMLCKKGFGRYVEGYSEDTIAFNKLVYDLKRIKIREYQFKDLEQARSSFRKLAYEPNVVMRGDTSWLHGDNGKFWFDAPGDWNHRDTILQIEKIFPNEKYSMWFQEQRGVIWIDCDKSFYDKFNLYPKSEFQRPQKFSFVIYKKVE